MAAIPGLLMLAMLLPVALGGTVSDWVFEEVIQGSR
jgi:hypothetical protein